LRNEDTSFSVRLDDSLMERAQEEARRRGVTLGYLIEQGLRHVLCQPVSHAASSAVVLPECHAGGGVLPGVDLNDSANLLEWMESRD
jgi:hypothetical protein